MNILTLFGERIAELRLLSHQKVIRDFAIDAFLNIYGCLLGGIKKNIIDVLAGFYNQGCRRNRKISSYREKRTDVHCFLCGSGMRCLWQLWHMMISSMAQHCIPVRYEAAILGLARRMPISGIQAIQAFR